MEETDDGELPHEDIGPPGDPVPAGGVAAAPRNGATSPAWVGAAYDGRIHLPVRGALEQLTHSAEALMAELVLLAAGPAGAQATLPSVADAVGVCRTPRWCGPRRPSTRP